MSWNLSAAGALVPLWAGLCLGGTPNVSFKQPTGIAIGPSGEFYIVSVDGGQPVITKDTPSQSRVFRVPIAGAEAGEGPGRIVYDGTLSMLWYLAPTGRLLFVNPTLGTSGLFADLRTLPLDTSKTVDVGKGTMQAFAGQLQTQQATWGDIAVLWSKTDQAGAEGVLLMTGVVAGIPFVARIRLAYELSEQKLQARIVGSEVVIASQAVKMAAPTGVAIDPGEGLAFTTLPVGNPSQTAPQEQFIYFPFDLGLRHGVLVAFTGLAISSRGIAADQYHGVYFAPGAGGIPICSPAASVLYLNVSYPAGQCFTVAGGEAQDVAVDSTATFAYVTLGPSDTIKLIQVPPSQGRASSDSAAAR